MFPENAPHRIPTTFRTAPRKSCNPTVAIAKAATPKMSVRNSNFRCLGLWVTRYCPARERDFTLGWMNLKRNQRQLLGSYSLSALRFSLACDIVAAGRPDRILMRGGSRSWIGQAARPWPHNCRTRWEPTSALLQRWRPLPDMASLNCLTLIKARSSASFAFTNLARC